MFCITGVTCNYRARRFFLQSIITFRNQSLLFAIKHYFWQSSIFPPKPGPSPPLTNPGSVHMHATGCERQGHLAYVFAPWHEHKKHANSKVIKFKYRLAPRQDCSKTK